MRGASSWRHAAAGERQRLREGRGASAVAIFAMQSGASALRWPLRQAPNCSTR
jgi:hypothetical protein